MAYFQAVPLRNIKPLDIHIETLAAKSDETAGSRYLQKGHEQIISSERSFYLTNQSARSSIKGRLAIRNGRGELEVYTVGSMT